MLRHPLGRFPGVLVETLRSYLRLVGCLDLFLAGVSCRAKFLVTEREFGASADSSWTPASSGALGDLGLFLVGVLGLLKLCVTERRVRVIADSRWSPDSSGVLGWSGLFLGVVLGSIQC